VYNHPNRLSVYPCFEIFKLQMALAQSSTRDNTQRRRGWNESQLIDVTTNDFGNAETLAVDGEDLGKITGAAPQQHRIITKNPYSPVLSDYNGWNLTALQTPEGELKPFEGLTISEVQDQVGAYGLSYIERRVRREALQEYRNKHGTVHPLAQSARWVTARTLFTEGSTSFLADGTQRRLLTLEVHPPSDNLIFKAGPGFSFRQGPRVEFNQHVSHTVRDPISTAGSPNPPSRRNEIWEDTHQVKQISVFDRRAPTSPQSIIAVLNTHVIVDWRSSRNTDVQEHNLDVDQIAAAGLPSSFHPTWWTPQPPAAPGL
jgi:hypothetical protein